MRLRSLRRLTALVVGVVVGVAALTACGETFDLSDLDDDPSTDPGVTIVVSPLDTPIPDDAPVAELLPAMLQGWRGLDQRVIDRDRDDEALDRIERIWRKVEPELRAERPALLFGFEQAIDLARSSVERNRPADASKGYKLAVDLTNDYLER